MNQNNWAIDGEKREANNKFSPLKYYPLVTKRQESDRPDDDARHVERCESTNRNMILVIGGRVPPNILITRAKRMDQITHVPTSSNEKGRLSLTESQGVPVAGRKFIDQGRHRHGARHRDGRGQRRPAPQAEEAVAQVEE